MAEKIYRELGVRIARLRMQHGLSQSRVAAMLHIAQTTYSNYENGSHRITLEHLQVLAAFYDVSYDELLGEPLGGQDFDEREMIARLSRLNAFGKSKVMDYIDDLSVNEKYTDKG